MTKRGYEYTGLDLNKEMLECSRDKAKKLKVTAEFILGGMGDFRLDHKVEFAYIMLDSLYVKNTAEMISHFDSIGKVIRPGGLYLLDWCVGFSPISNSSGGWEMERDGIRIKTTYSTYSTKIIDCVEQIVEETITLQVDEKG